MTACDMKPCDGLMAAAPLFIVKADNIFFIDNGQRPESLEFQCSWK